MAVKKSDLYSSLWASCDELRGGMDASQYKDYVLFMLFIKYVSDKYGNSDVFAPPITIPKGANFKDMVALKGKSDIGDKINTQVIQPLIDANSRLARSDFPDFNDPNKLGEGKERVEKLSNLIAIFENPALDFSKNRAEHDDILGDAYEYLMRNFAVQSGKSKGQFLTPSEVSRIIAKVIGISPENTKASTTAYDPTCGSGSLLLKVAAEAGKHITLEGQEKDVTTAGLARMNMILHDFPTANILPGNTLASPKFKDGEQLRTYDYVVANPPFSDKTWSNGITPSADPYQRFAWGEPPAKQGDYAYLLHILRSLKSTGKGACILPHGVLFRGNAEAVIREQLVRSGYGRVVYSHKTHEKCADILLTRHKRIKFNQILISAVLTGGLIATLFDFGSLAEYKKLGAYFAVVLSTILLVLNSYTKDYDLGEIAQKHRQAGADLWIIREKYLSLLTDLRMEVLSLDAVRSQRDQLVVDLHAVYTGAPSTNFKAYVEAQKALKKLEDMTFSDDEIDAFLPKELKRK